MKKDKYFTHNKTWMTADLFKEGDVVAPSFGTLAGVRGVVAHVGSYVTIEFPRPVSKYPNDGFNRARRMWGYDPSNVRLIAFKPFRSEYKKRGENSKNVLDIS